MEWKWTRGEPYKKSIRPTYNKSIPDEINQNKTDEEFSREIEKSAYSTSLNHDENTWDILNQSLAQNGFRQSSKRETLDNKIADRDLVQQRGFNPFLNDTNYVEDISVSDMFLKPMNTTQDREKPNNLSAE
jgi:hypothetical protein